MIAPLMAESGRWCTRSCDHEGCEDVLEDALDVSLKAVWRSGVTMTSRMPEKCTHMSQCVAMVMNARRTEEDRPRYSSIHCRR